MSSDSGMELSRGGQNSRTAWLLRRLKPNMSLRPMGLKKLYSLVDLPTRFCKLTQIRPIIFNDSQGAVALVKNHLHHNASKHIEVRYHFVRDWITKGKFSLEKISTVIMLRMG